VLLIRVQSVIAGVAATRSSSFGGPLGDEAPGGGEADAAVACGDDRDFPFQFL
jgi:hypothetical protein